LDNYQTQLTPESPWKEPGKKHSAWLGFLIDSTETILLALVLFFGINAVSSRVIVENISMKPTLQPGELLLINKLAYKLGSPRHGDIVVFHYQGNPNEDYIKRLIGLPGDVVHVSEGVVNINNFALYEPYIAAPPTYEGTWTVPDGKYFVLGDNRNNSSDSHQWGFVSMEDVVGEAIFIYWPLDRIQSLNIPDLVQAAQ